jgi:hypothetical protein
MTLPQATTIPAPAPPPPPSAEVAQIVVDGRPLGGPSDVYQAFVAQRRELTRQLSSLENTRSGIANRLRQESVQGADRAGLEARLKQVDERIARISQDIAVADANVARAAGVPGAVVQPAPPRQSGPPDEAWVLGGIFLFVAILPLSIAWARRIMRRGDPKATAFLASEMSERFTRLEQAVDAVAIEVERIGEGQRYMAHRLGAGAAEAIPLPQREAVPR